MIETQGKQEQVPSAKAEGVRASDPGAVGLSQQTNKRKIITAEALLSREFPELRYAVQGLLPEGLFLLVSPPKSGKSFMVLDIACAVALGGKVLGKLDVTEAGDVLCLILEDGERRLQQRLSLLTGDIAPNRLHLATEWPHLNEGGLARIEEWVMEQEQAKLIVIDTLQRVRPRERPGANLYAQDYAALAPLADFAHKYRVCILVVHHTRKSESNDPFDRVSGTTGLTGAVDGTLMLVRDRGTIKARLLITGRDVEERELQLERNKETGGWILLGDVPEEMQMLSPERQAVIDVYKPGMTVKEVASILGRPENTVKQLLWKMKRGGQLVTSDNLSSPHNPDNRDNLVTNSGEHSQVTGLLTTVTNHNQDTPPSFQGDKREVIEVITPCTQSMSELNQRQAGAPEAGAPVDYLGSQAEDVTRKRQPPPAPEDCSLEAAA